MNILFPQHQNNSLLPISNMFSSVSKMQASFRNMAFSQNGAYLWKKEIYGRNIFLKKYTQNSLVHQTNILITTYRERRAVVLHSFSDVCFQVGLRKFSQKNKRTGWDSVVCGQVQRKDTMNLHLTGQRNHLFPIGKQSRADKKL